MVSEPENGRVIYSVKELLGRIDVKIDKLTETIDHRFNDVDQRFSEHETRIRTLEVDSVTQDALERAEAQFRATMYKSVAAIVSLLGIIVAVVNLLLV